MTKLKFKVGKRTSINWWNDLSLSEKTTFKNKYEVIRESDNNFPNMVNTKETRISKLTGNQIRCIWRFKDHKSKN